MTTTLTLTHDWLTPHLVQWMIWRGGRRVARSTLGYRTEQDALDNAAWAGHAWDDVRPLRMTGLPVAR